MLLSRPPPQSLKARLWSPQSQPSPTEGTYRFVDLSWDPEGGDLTNWNHQVRISNAAIPWLCCELYTTAYVVMPDGTPGEVIGSWPGEAFEFPPGLIWWDGVIPWCCLTTQLLTTTGTGQTVTTPATWNNTSNNLYGLSAGGSDAGGTSTLGSGGGGSGGFATAVNQTLTGGAANKYQVGTGGGTTGVSGTGATWFGSTGTSVSNSLIGIQAGSPGTNGSGSGAGAGAVVTSGTGTRTAGAAGGNGNNQAGSGKGGGGGGAPPGPNGAGGAGANGASSGVNGGNGGRGDGATGGTAGVQGSTGGAGGAGSEMPGGVGAGGGGGGAQGATISASKKGGAGGNYGAGAGGGGSDNSAGVQAGSQGVVILAWTPAIFQSFNQAQRFHYLTQ